MDKVYITIISLLILAIAILHFAYSSKIALLEEKLTKSEASLHLQNEAISKLAIDKSKAQKEYDAALRNSETKFKRLKAQLQKELTCEEELEIIKKAQREFLGK